MKLYWLDCETEGLDPEEHGILEVAIAVADLTSPFDATPIYHAVLPSFARTYGTPLHPRVVEMHEKNGLFLECAGSTLSHRFVEEEILALLPPHEGDEPDVLAGSSVHFDHAFLSRHMPTLADRFSHRHYDVSAVKLFCRSLGMQKLPRAEAHRAREDVLESIEHARLCARWLANAPNAVRWWPMVDPRRARLDPEGTARGKTEIRAAVAGVKGPVVFPGAPVAHVDLESGARVSLVASEAVPPGEALLVSVGGPPEHRVSAVKITGLGEGTPPQGHDPAKKDE